MIVVLLLALSAADVASQFSDVRLEKPFDRYLLANPLLMEATGVKIVRLPGGRSVILSVASATIKDGSAKSRLQAEQVCRAKAFAYLVRERKGVQVYHTQESSEKTVIIREGNDERGRREAEVTETIISKVEGIAKDLAVVGRWKSREGDVMYLAIGAICDSRGKPIPQRAGE